MAIQIPRDFRRVIIAASVGNVIEWYDFYIFGSLAAVLSVKFFEQSHPVAALLSTIALFTAGFLIRPLGAFLFGWMGDRVGRKYTFLVTLSGMGLGTGAIGLIPTYASIGLTAAFLAYAWAASMAAPSPTLPSMCRTKAAATTPAGCRPLRLSGSWCRWL
jgi:MFS family permease